MKKHLKDYFIPHKGNDYSPHSLQKAAMLGMVILVLLTFTVANIQSLIWISSDWLVSTVLPAVIVDLTNDERTDDTLNTLRRNFTLDAAAQLKAEHMAKNEYFSHYAPDGTSPWYWFSEANYNFVHAGENLAIHFTDSSEVIDAWMDSPAHRANILNGDYAEIGVGTAEGEFEGFTTVYVVQFFGTQAAATSPSVAPLAIASTPEVAGEEVIVEPVIASEPEDTVVLAEAVEIIEDIEVIEPEQVLAEDAEVEEASTSEVTEIADVIVTDNGVALHSDFLSTTTGGVPASIDTISDSGGNAGTSPLFKLITQPQLLLQIMYVGIALFVLSSLVLSVAIEWRRQQPVQIAYSVALLLLIFGLFQLHTALNSGVVII